MSGDPAAREDFVRSLRAPLPASADAPYLAFREALDVNWSDELEALHEESSRDHFIDVATRRALMDPVRPFLGHGEVVVDLGCSSGHMLADLRAACADCVLTGIDLVARGLERAREQVPDAVLLLADATDLPLESESVDALVSANVLEHIADHRRAVAEVHRVLRPGGRAVFVVPAGVGLFDYYDEFLGHERRYSRGELARIARSAGFEVYDDHHIGVLVFPAFWLVKKVNRVRCRDLRGDALVARVEADIARTENSRIGDRTRRLEEALHASGVPLPIGIRNCVVVDKA